MDRMQTPELAAQLLLEGLEAEKFLVSAVKDTQERLQLMATNMLAPASDQLDASGRAVPVLQQASLRVPASRRAEALARFQAIATVTRSHDGCQAYEIATDASDSNVIRIFEVWRDQAALDAHVAAPETLAFLGQIFAMGATEFSIRPLGA